MKALLYESEVKNAWLNHLRNAKQFRIAMALVKTSGIKLILPTMESILRSGVKGQFLIGVDMPTDPESIEILCGLRDAYNSRLELAYFRPAKRRMFHAKLGLFQSSGGKWSAIIGSSNLTNGGLCDNYEANVLVDDSSVAKQLLAYFAELFQGGGAKDVTKQWLDHYRVIWAKRAKLIQLLDEARRSVGRINNPPSGKPVPRRIKGYEFAFTGGIEDWPRERVLYPMVRKHHGTVVDSPAGLSHADCLVHGDLLDGQNTLKLIAARENKIPVIQEDEFFQILANEERLRKRP